MVSKKELEKLIADKQEIVDRNYQCYQETGEQRYYRTYTKAEDLVGIFRVALNAADEHQSYIALKSQLAGIRSKCERARNGEKSMLDEVLIEIISLCHLFNI